MNHPICLQIWHNLLLTDFWEYREDQHDIGDGPEAPEEGLTISWHIVQAAIHEDGEHQKDAHRTMNSLLRIRLQPYIRIYMKGDTQLAATPGSKKSDKVIESFRRLNEGKRTKDEVVYMTDCKGLG